MRKGIAAEQRHSYGRWRDGSAMVGRGTYRGCERAMITESTITCPLCGASKVETMPTDACQLLYECANCGTALRPKTGDCCVFCSYGSVPCPTRQDSN